LDYFNNVVGFGFWNRLFYCEGVTVINPGLYDITCPQGASFDQTFTYKVGGTAVNLTGYTAALQVREAYDGGTALISLSTGGSGITLGGTAGTILAEITATVTASVAAGSYAYDLELYQGSTVTRLLQGGFTVTGGVTR
jgi:hypothetical protein